SPGVRSSLLRRLRDGEECPHPLAGPDVEGLHRAGRIAAVLKPLRHPTPDDREILVNHGWRRDLRLQARNVTTEVRGHRRGAPSAKRRVMLACLRINGEEALAPANEQARLAIVTPPEGEATTVVAGVRERWSLFVGSRVEDPELPSRLGVERCDSME